MSKIKQNFINLNLPQLTTLVYTTEVKESRAMLSSREVQTKSRTGEKRVGEFEVEQEKEIQKTPKMKNAKSEILKIPKARQLLNMDKHIYLQDIQKRLELLGDVKQQNYKPETINQLHTLCKPVKKKTKRHKTNFKIPLTKQNIQKMNAIVKSHIDINKKYTNQEKVILREYEKSAPFNLDTLKFFDEMDQRKRIYKERFNYEKGNLAKNNLILQHVILNRNIKRELVLKKREQVKMHAKNVMEKLL